MTNTANELGTVHGVSSTLNSVLLDIQTNRTNLATQIVQQKAQIANGEAQLVKFDALIAALQACVADENHVASVVQQAAVNALASTTDTQAGPSAADTASAEGTSEAPSASAA